MTMKRWTRLSILGVAALVAACGQSIAGRCAAANGDGTAAAERCIQVAQSRILTSPGSAFAKSQRGGGG